MRPIVEEWYTYQEILNCTDAGPTSPHSKAFASDWFSDVLDELGIEIAVFTLSEFFTDSLVSAIVDSVMTIVYERHSRDYIYHRLPAEGDLTDDDLREALCPIVNVVNLTLPRYIPLLQQNEYASTDPIAPVTSRSTGKTRFSDTPQNGGLFEDDDHTTNLTQSETESSVDSASLMERLDMMFRNFRSVILEWSNEFNRLFLKEEQL